MVFKTVCDRFDYRAEDLIAKAKKAPVPAPGFYKIKEDVEKNKIYKPSRGGRIWLRYIWNI